MANTLESVVGPPPHAPHAIDPEDVLGPVPHAPHAPHVGNRGKALSLAQALRRSPAAPRVGRPTQSAAAPHQVAGRPQTIVVENKTKVEEKDKEKGIVGQAVDTINPFSPANMAGRRADRAARLAAAKKAANLDGADETADDGGPGIPADMKAKRASQFASMRATLDAMRNPDENKDTRTPQEMADDARIDATNKAAADAAARVKRVRPQPGGDA